MSKVILFMMTSLDGYFEGPNHDLSWHHVDEEFNAFATKQLQEAGKLLFGRRTYELMADYWPTAVASDLDDATVARQMNILPKIVFSKTLQSVKETENWRNVTFKHEVDADEITELKEKSDKPIMVLGSSSLCVTLLEKGLFDEIRIMINPVVIGAGTALFHGIQKKVELQLRDNREFKNGNVLLTYTVEK